MPHTLFFMTMYALLVMRIASRDYEKLVWRGLGRGYAWESVKFVEMNVSQLSNIVV